MANYTVKKGDTLSGIAAKNNTTVNNLLSLNPDITNKDLIYVGQVIVISGTAAPKTKNSTQRPKITNFGLQSGTEGTVFATWAWDKANTDHYEIEWKYGTGDGVGFIGERSTTNAKQSIYSSAPANATNVTFRVKPVSKTRPVGKNKVETAYWKADWSTVKRYYFVNAPGIPPIPTVTMSGNKLTAKIDNISDDLNATYIEFKVVKGVSKVVRKGVPKITNKTATYTCTVESGGEYRVACRAVRGKLYSDWSDFTDYYSSLLAPSSGIYLLYALSSTSVALNWYDVAKAKGYEIQYTTNKRYFDSNPNGVSSITLGSKDEPTTVGHAEITGLETGHEYFFRVRPLTFNSTNDAKTAWTAIKSITLGTVPTAPTTWSSSQRVNVGDPLTLYWTHNPADGSYQMGAQVELTVNGTSKIYTIRTGTSATDANTAAKVVALQGFKLTTGAVIRVSMTFANTLQSITLNVNKTGAKEVIAGDAGTVSWDGPSLVEFRYDGSKWILTNANADQSGNSYAIDTSIYDEGTVLQWRVKTAGIFTYTDTSKNEDGLAYGPWSMQRTVNIYAPPVLAVSLTDSSGSEFEQLTSYPLYVNMTESSANQNPNGYLVTVVSNDDYETVDNLGNSLIVSAGSEVYHKYFDVSEKSLIVALTPSDVTLENNVNYKVICTVSMDSGLTGEVSESFDVLFEGDEYWPDAEVGYDESTYSAVIRPFCNDEDGNLVEGVTLSVYRREFDGSFVEIETGLENTSNTYITDPHPSLDFARYRVVAINDKTGSISYYDVPGVPVEESSILIQWDEEWSSFDNVEDAEPEEQAWTGSLVKLPYNIDVSDDYSGDVELVEYIGREHPVSYYGTQIGHTATWKTDIPKDDKDTIYALRRLARWMGDVYVREPSGTGYWANVSVSFDQQHIVLTVPVTITVKRVEGEK